MYAEGAYYGLIRPNYYSHYLIKLGFLERSRRPKCIGVQWLKFLQGSGVKEGLHAGWMSEKITDGEGPAISITEVRNKDSFLAPGRKVSFLAAGSGIADRGRRFCFRSPPVKHAFQL